MAAQDISANLHYPMQANLTGSVFALTIEKFEGSVHEIIQKEAILDGVYKHMPLIGTDTMSNNAMGQPTLQKVVAGVEPLGKEIEVGKMIVQVKNPIIARVTTPMLATVQTHLDIKGKTPGNFAKKLAKSIDELKFQQIVKSALYDHGASSTEFDGSSGILPKGSTVTLATALDELDTTKLTTAIYAMAQALAELDINFIGEGNMYMAPAQYFTLLKNHDLLNTDFNKPNGSYAHSAIDVASGMPVIMTNRLSQEVDTYAANASTDSIAALYAVSGETHYETSATEAKAVALYATSDSIMVAESIPMTSDVYWEKRLLSWFIDAYTAIGAAPDRTDVTGAIFSA